MRHGRRTLVFWMERFWTHKSVPEVPDKALLRFVNLLLELEYDAPYESYFIVFREAHVPLSYIAW